jgi:tetratricopeptide (TPR) repeat protein
MAIKGSLKEASFADVLQLLALGRKTGCLSVSDRSSFGRIYFEQGWITHASILNRRDRLGDLLVRNGVVSRDDLQAAISEQTGQTPERLGEILVRRGSLRRDQLEHFIRVQIEDAIYFLFTWTQGSFYFEAAERPDPGEILVAINPESVLLEGARRVDEWTLIEKKIPSSDLVFGLDLTHGDPASADLTPQQRRVMGLIDGHRTVSEITEESGLLEFETAKALFGLVHAGFARPRGRRRETARAAVRETRLQEHINLGIAFYRTSMLEESEREFLRVQELSPGHVESLFRLASIALRQGQPRVAIRRLMEVIESGARGAGAFHNLALALESCGRFEDALLAVDEGLASHPRSRPLLLARGILTTRLGALADACEAFGAYRSGAAGEAPPASFYAFAIVALGGIGRLDEARSTADEGLALHPRNPQLLVNAAALLQRTGFAEDAEALYRRATDEAPDLTQARRGLADSLYRRGDYDGAGEIYAKLLESPGEGGASELHFRMGNIAYKRGRRDDAVVHWRRTVELEPQHTVARTNLELVEGVAAPGMP